MIQIGTSKTTITITKLKIQQTKINIMRKDTVSKIQTGINRILVNKIIRNIVSKITKIISNIINKIKISRIIIITKKGIRNIIKMNHKIKQIIIRIRHLYLASKLKSIHSSRKAVS